MKFKKIAILTLAVAMLSISAFAQRGEDLFGAPRTVVLVPTTTLGAASGSVTNGPIDVRIFDGIANIILFSGTNSGTTGGTLTATLLGSVDQTNFTAVSGFAIATNTSTSYTNFWYGTNGLKATQTFMLPGTVISPTAATAGFATPYLFQSPFTNTGAITLVGNLPTSIGFDVGDSPRYLYVVWQPGGTVTNFTVSGVLSGATHSGQLY